MGASQCSMNAAHLDSDSLHGPITKEQVLAAQKKWGEGIVRISAAKTNGENYEEMARDHINTLYGFQHSTVLFKPTLASEMQFRPDFDSALSYFVATNKVAPEDTGFAIKGWTKCRWENSDIILAGDTATAMGNYYFTSGDGSEVKVEYTFGYFLGPQGEVRINLHHSSVPYQMTRKVTKEQVLAAQKRWGEGIVSISAAKRRGDDFEQMARDHINSLYGFEHSAVLFKPTLASKMQFRPDFDSALSYFVATNGVASEDTGFAIKGWTNCRWENSEIILAGETATAMGNYYFTAPEGNEVKVEYTFGYFLDPEGSLRINVHHSSVPYAATSKISREQVLNAQKFWGDGIVRISAAKKKGEDYVEMARDHIRNLYGFEHSTVLFKPTLASKMQFRNDFESALSYFVASNGVAAEDTGFAIKGWTKCRWENSDIILSGDTAKAMGNYFFTAPEGHEVKVEYSFGYFLDQSGNLRINLHHSSMPYDAGNARPPPRMAVSKAGG